MPTLWNSRTLIPSNSFFEAFAGSLHSLPDSFIGNRLLFTELSKRNAFNPQSSARITALLFARLPSAITRFIVAVIVDPAKSFARRWVTHILSKIFKRSPTRANLNASPAVVVKVPCVRVTTPAVHMNPGFIKAASRMRFSMSHHPLSGQFSCKTSTRHRSAKEIVARHPCSTAALALTQPINSSPIAHPFTSIFRSNNKSSEASASQARYFHSLL